MRTARRVRRNQRGISPLVFAAVGLFLALVVVAAVAVSVGPEIEHRTDNSWHYERVTLTNCMGDGTLSQNQGFGYLCSFATVPPLPFAIDSYLDVDGSNHAPRSTSRWVHVVNGRITGTAGGSTLWFLGLLIIPALMVAGFARSVRHAHRAGRRWRDPRD